MCVITELKQCLHGEGEPFFSLRAFQWAIESRNLMFGADSLKGPNAQAVAPLA